MIVTPPGAASLTAPDPPKPKDAADAARQFEALLIAQLLRGAHESSGGSLEEESDSMHETMWDVAAQQFAQLLAERRGVGLAALITPSIASPRSS